LIWTQFSHRRCRTWNEHGFTDVHGFWIHVESYIPVRNPSACGK
jgi:hypothetical protein